METNTHFQISIKTLLSNLRCQDRTKLEPFHMKIWSSLTLGPVWAGSTGPKSQATWSGPQAHSAAKCTFLLEIWSICHRSERSHARYLKRALRKLFGLPQPGDQISQPFSSLYFTMTTSSFVGFRSFRRARPGYLRGKTPQSFDCGATVACCKCQREASLVHVQGNFVDFRFFPGHAGQLKRKEGTQGIGTEGERWGRFLIRWNLIRQLSPKLTNL